MLAFGFPWNRTNEDFMDAVKCEMWVTYHRLYKKPSSDAKPRRAPNLIQVDGKRFGRAEFHRRLG
jgi:hypothetical protein